jgi:hypothetical protein
MKGDTAIGRPYGTVGYPRQQSGNPRKSAAMRLLGTMSARSPRSRRNKAPWTTRLITLSGSVRSATQGPRHEGLLFRSRMQRRFRTCNLSVDVPHLRVHVHGRPWSSVAVDVLTDVDEGGSSVADSGRWSVCCQALIWGQVLLHQPWRSDHGSCMGGIPSAWRSPTTRCPGGNVPPLLQPSLPCLPPGHRVVALVEVDGMPRPRPGGLDARVSNPRDLPGCGVVSARVGCPLKPGVRLSAGRQPAH